MKGNFGLVISVVFGAFIFFLYPYIFFRNFKYNLWTPLNILLFISGSIMLINILLLAYGRSGFELNKSLSSRYAIYSIILVILFILFFYERIIYSLTNSKKIFSYLFNILFILIVLQYIKVFPSVFFEKDKIDKKQLGLNSLIHKDYNSDYLSSIYDNKRINKLIRNFEYIEKTNPNLYIFKYFKDMKNDEDLIFSAIDSHNFTKNRVPNTDYEKIELKVKKSDKKIIYLYDYNNINVGYALIYRKDKHNSHYFGYLPVGTNPIFFAI